MTKCPGCGLEFCGPGWDDEPPRETPEERAAREEELRRLMRVKVRREMRDLSRSRSNPELDKKLLERLESFGRTRTDP